MGQMLLKQTFSCDVLVIGSGIAGISAALKAAEAGRSVILACKGKLFSGSSFYPGTWGLGLIGPDGQADEADLAASIQSIGCHVADPEMVKTFVSGIQPAISRIRDMGVKLRRADNRDQKEFIPCFDHKHRDWNGIEFDSAREILGQRLAEFNVTILSGYEALELVKKNGAVCGAVFALPNSFSYIGCRALVLATGGYGSLFKYHLCTEDVMGSGHHLALTAGCELINMEFMQMMPGYISPAYKTVFNEKTFRFSHFCDHEGRMLFDDPELLETRSSHGPFTTRLASKEVDIAIFNEFKRDPNGIRVTYSDSAKSNLPEFVKVYFDWLLETKGISIHDPIHIGIFAHAANGGIRISPDASTGIPGLYAAGEVTGGMHGADRIGGLSTANGLVFGTIAGDSAAAFAARPACIPEAMEFEACASGDIGPYLKTLQQTMFENAMILRSEAGLLKALSVVTQLRADITKKAEPCEDPLLIAQTRRFLARCTTAECVLRAALLRRESRGSHNRTDYPRQNPSLEKIIALRLKDDKIQAEFK